MRDDAWEPSRDIEYTDVVIWAGVAEDSVAWVRENVKDRWYWDFGNCNLNQFRVRFANKNDAIMFKLTWGGNV